MPSAPDPRSTLAWPGFVPPTVIPRPALIRTAGSSVAGTRVAGRIRADEVADDPRVLAADDNAVVVARDEVRVAPGHATDLVIRDGVRDQDPDVGAYRSDGGRRWTGRGSCR